MNGTNVLEISELNKGWGICGFASALGALYQNKAIGGAIDQAVSHNQLNTRLLAEIKSYLVMLQSENNNLLLDEIARFTRSFGGVYASFTIQAYINKISSIGSNIANVGKDFSIAMPPNGVADFLRRIGGVKAVLVGGSCPELNDAILGLGDKTVSDQWKGLRHWVYKKGDSEIYNWGKKETRAQLLAHDANWQIVFQIAMG